MTPAVRMIDGKPTDPYRILQELIDEHRDDLKEAKIEILWRSGWRSDADGFTQMLAVKKAGDVDRALSVKADFAVLLNKENFPRLNDRLKTVYMHHALCHMKPMMDSDGEQKQDDKGRKMWRIVKRHDIEQFSEIVKLYGNDCLQLDEEAKAAIADTTRPLLAEMEKSGGEKSATSSGSKSRNASAAGEANDSGASTSTTTTAQDTDADGWKRLAITELQLPPAVESFVISAGYRRIGKFSEYMAEKGEFWDKDLKVGGQRKPANFREKIEEAFLDFWRDHPEYTQA